MTLYRVLAKIQRSGMTEASGEVKVYETTNLQALQEWMAANISEPYTLQIEALE